jgi:major membrane immunogen (membrane-anchored lipoprotein)
MTLWKDGFAVAYLGGYQGQYTAGGIDLVNLASGAMTTLVDGATLDGGSMVPSVCRADADTLYFIGQQYNADYTASLYTLYRLRAGDVQKMGETSSAGYMCKVDYDAKNASGFIKAWDNEYMRIMNAVDHTYPNAYMRYYESQLLEKQSADIDVLTGASTSHVSFTLLAEAVIEHARANDTSVAVVEVPKQE